MRTFSGITWRRSVYESVEADEHMGKEALHIHEILMTLPWVF